MRTITVITCTIVIMMTVFLTGATCQVVTIEPPGIQRVDIIAPDNPVTGDEVTAIAVAVGWRADLTPDGSMVVNGMSVPFGNNHDGTYTAKYTIPPGASGTLNVTANVVLRDAYGLSSENKQAVKSLSVVRTRVAIIRWLDGEGEPPVCTYDGKFYRMYVGTQPGSYPRIDVSRTYAVGDSLQWHIPDLMIGQAYYFRVEELYPGQSEGNVSDEVGFMIHFDRSERIE